MEKNLQPFPDVETIKKGIQFFKSFDWTDALKELDSQERYDYIGNKFFEHFETNPIAFLKPYIKENLDLTLFRVRQVDDSINSNLFCEFSYPPRVLTRTQRANYAQNPIFYSSPDVATAFIETLRNLNDIDGDKLYFMSCWGFRNPKGLKVSFLAPENLPADNPITDVELDNDLEDIGKREGFDEKQIESFKELVKYQISLFTDPDEKTYNLSAFIGHHFLYAPHNYSTDILVYPSILSKFLTANFAIHPNIVDANLYLKQVFVCKIKKLNIETRECSMTVLQYGKVVNGLIHWRDVSPEDVEYRDLINKYINPVRRVFKEN